LGRVNRPQFGIHLHQLGLVLRQQQTFDGNPGTLRGSAWPRIEILGLSIMGANSRAR